MERSSPELPPPQRPLLADCFALGIAGLAAHKLRSALAALGIVIGVAATICVVTLMQTLTASVNRQFQGLGSRTLTVHAYTSVDDALHGRMHRLKLTDLEALRRALDDIQDITPRITVGGTFSDVSAAGVTTRTRVSGTTSSYEAVHQSYPQAGRFLTDDDDRTRRRVCVLGDRVRQDLKLPGDGVGAFVIIGGDWFKVVGVMERRGDMLGISQDDYVLVPYGTALSLNAGGPEQDLAVTFNAPSEARVEEIRERAVAVLERLRGAAPGQEADFRVETASQLRATYEELSRKVTGALGGIVGVSLLVAGIGIMNIMFVSVSERTREIGIAKALGATDAFILRQFLVEAGLLALLGGAAGAALGLVAGYGLSSLIPDAPRAWPPWWAIVLPLATCGLVGIVFGIVPASKAASILPVEALRHE